MSAWGWRTSWAQALARLPASSRHTLGVLAVVALLALPHLGHLSTPAAILVVGVLAGRSWQTVRHQALPPRWLAVTLLILAVALARWGKPTVRDMSIDLAVVLLALKTLELKGARDTFVLFYLGFFVLLLHFLFSQSLLTAAFMVLGTWALLAMLVSLHVQDSPQPLAVALRTSGKTLLWGTPLVAVLFVFFPRVAPLWGVPQGALQGKSGLSERMTVGEVARLALDDSIAFRVRFQGATPPPHLLYFRGPVLSRYDGQTWTAAPPQWTSTDTTTASGGQPVIQDIMLEPQDQPWLFSMDLTAGPPRRADGTPFPARYSADGQWISNSPLLGVVAYRASSLPGAALDADASPASLSAYTRLPVASNPRTVAMAQSLRDRYPESTANDAQAISTALLVQLRTGGYQYTLEPGTYGLHAADEFWFDRKRGFCEHISSAYVVAMRAAGVPARVVTGYQGGDRNPLDGWWTVRQSDAHAWAEYWQPGAGWVRVDPTAAVAPARVGELQRLAPTPGLIGNTLRAINPSWVSQLRASWEAINGRWNQWVLGYQAAQQMNLLHRLGLSDPDWKQLGVVLSAAVAALGVGVLVWQRWTSRTRDPWMRLWQGIQTRAARQGLASDAATTPRRLAMTLVATHGDAAQAWSDWLLELERQRYAPPTRPAGDHVGASKAPTNHTSRWQLQELAARVKRMPWPGVPS